MKRLHSVWISRSKNDRVRTCAPPLAHTPTPHPQGTLFAGGIFPVVAVGFSVFQISRSPDLLSTPLFSPHRIVNRCCVLCVVLCCVGLTTENHRRRFRYVMNHTTERWASGFLTALDRATHLSDELSFVTVGFGSSVRLVGLRSDFSHLKEEALTNAYSKSDSRILIFDYDGTITTTAQKLVCPFSQNRMIVCACMP